MYSALAELRRPLHLKVDKKIGSFSTPFPPPFVDCLERERGGEEGRESQLKITLVKSAID